MLVQQKWAARRCVSQSRTLGMVACAPPHVCHCSFADPGVPLVPIMQVVGGRYADQTMVRPDCLLGPV